ncbi:YcaO-like family protein [Litoribacillus peritrichatus]|uniref:YcaO domain-containing protein n=1 Tax=Litoribacillus peritrichatus TaxID=718191 RepID=A0ABP7N2Z5_9GAMM
MKLEVQRKSGKDGVVLWHPSFGVYIFDNKDVLLISEQQQLWLPQSQFPYLDQLNGELTCSQIIAEQREEDSQKQAMFYFQVKQLLESNILLNSEIIEEYLAPDFDNNRDLEPQDFSHNTSLLDVINLSLIEIESIYGLTDLLVQSVEDAFVNTQTKAKITYILVDDFLNPRITQVELNEPGSVLVVKLTGESCWISPLYSHQDFTDFLNLQKRILDNQPVRKAAMIKWPASSLGLPVRNSVQFTEAQLQDLKKLIILQMTSSAPTVLAVYRKSDCQTERHPINIDLGNTDDMSRQIHSPVHLNACLNRFNKDGGSRSVSAQETVDRLCTLVSPVTGVINHLKEVEFGTNSPVKVYRSGFFKTPSDLKPEVMEQGFVQICMGKGVSPIQSQASALCEAVERYNALYQPDIPLIKSRHSELIVQGQRVLIFQDLTPYSEAQYQKFNDPVHPDSQLKQAAQPYLDQPIHWLPVWSLTHEAAVHVPLSQCFSEIPFEDVCFGRWHSNGCAAGNSLEEAILQGVFELIERDAVAIWWYNRLKRPEFDLSRLDQENLSKLKQTLSPDDEAGHEFWVLDLTLDVGVPVMAAIGKSKADGGFVMGFGCHLTPEIAAQRALTELCQLIPIRNQNGAPFDFDAMADSPYLYPDNFASAFPRISSAGDDLKDDVLGIVERLKTLKMEVLVLNYSRAQIPLNTVKVFVPGLCHIWPQFANERLYKVPVDLAMKDVALNESNINPHALYI